MIIALTSGSGNQSGQNSSGHPSSPSYQYGYDSALKISRDVIATANAELSKEGKAPNDSPAVLFGANGEYIARICDGDLQALILGGPVSGIRPVPVDFSSADYLQGCHDAAKPMLAAGH
jgi:hypothetical protein